MRNNESVSRELGILWEMRDRAKDDKAYVTAQRKIDEYFLGKPRKGRARKKKEKKQYIPEDEWGY